MRLTSPGDDDVGKLLAVRRVKQACRLCFRYQNVGLLRLLGFFFFSIFRVVVIVTIASFGLLKNPASIVCRDVLRQAGERSGDCFPGSRVGLRRNYGRVHP